MVKKKGANDYSTFIHLLLILVVLAAVLIPVGMVLQKPAAEAPAETRTEVQAETLQLQDFPSTDAGTFRGQLTPNYFKEPIDDVVILFASARLPGMMLIYYPYEQRLVGGTPQMVAENIVFFDGTVHELIYSFQRGGKQLMAYDGQLVAESDFRPHDAGSITGLVTGTTPLMLSEGVARVEIS